MMAKKGRNNILFLLFLCLLTPFQSAEAKERQTVSSWLYKRLETVEKQLTLKAYNKATTLLQVTLKKLQKTNYEQAITLRTLASVYALQGNYKQSAFFLEKSLATQSLPREQKLRTQLNLAQLYMADSQFQKAITVMEKWLRQAENPTGQDRILLAQAYAQLKQYKKALPQIKQAIASSPKPVEAWYQLQLALNYELERYSQCAAILKKLVRYYPTKKRYWTELAGIYQQLKKFKDALAIMELAYQKSLLNESKELIRLANLYLYLEIPAKSVTLLEKAFQENRIEQTEKNLEQLANSLIQAREYKRAEKPLEQAAKLSKTGQLYIRLGRIQIERESWSEAHLSLKRGLKKGSLKYPGQAWLLSGISCHESGDPLCAREAFTKALAFKKQKKSAQQWLNFLAESNI